MTANEMRDDIRLNYEKITSLGAPGLVDAEYSLFLSKAQRLFVLNCLNYKNNKNQEGLEETELRRQGLSALIKDSMDTSSTGTSISSTQDGTVRNGQFWDLPEDFMYSLMEEAYIDQIDCTEYPHALEKGDYNPSTTYQLNQIVFYNDQFYQSLRNNNSEIPENTDYWKVIDGANVDIRPISHNEYRKNYHNPYKNPFFDGSRGLIWRMNYSKETPVSDKRHELITDGTFNVLKYKLRYLKNPVDIVVNTAVPVNQVNSELDERTHDAICKLAINLIAEAVREQIPPTQPGFAINE